MPGRSRTAAAWLQAGRRQWKRPRYDTMKGSGDSAMRPRTIVILVLAGVIGVFLVVGLAGLFLAV
jgi:hypothetical protein